MMIAKRIRILFVAMSVLLAGQTAFSHNALPDTVAGVTAGDDALRRLGVFARNMTAYNSLYTQEKVYLHLDNTGYLPGETMWFKAYVFKASTLLPTDMSKVLYVELLNPHGQVVERRILPVNNGRTYGEFKLDVMHCRPGYYEVRAYTRAMLNWDDAYIFSRVLPIYEEPKDTTNFTGLTVGETEYYYKPGTAMRSVPEPLVDKAVQKHGSVMLAFYPEGGNIVRGVASTVAFRLTDKRGLPLNDTVRIYDAGGAEKLSVSPVHQGMGSFSLPADWTGGYATVAGNKGGRFELPWAQAEGCGLRVEHSADGGFNIRISPSPGMAGELLGISASCRGQLCHFSDVRPATADSIHIPYSRLRDGVHQITLFTPNGEILGERLIWCKPHHEAPVMSIRQNQESYKPFSPVVLDIDLKDAEGNPLRGDFSLSVRDADTETGRRAHSLQTDMLLASELKGYIRNPEYYFQSSDAHHRQALDLLLMVQGWRRYSWREMAGIDTFQLKQPAEDGLLFYGNLTPTNAMRKNLRKDDKLAMNFMMNTDKGTRLFSVDTDSTGRFALQLPDFYGDAPAVITVTNKKDKRIYTDLKINRNFSPPVKPYEPLALLPVSADNERIAALARPVETFDWIDTIPDLISKVIKLNTVNIKHKRVNYGYKPGFGLNWNDGEDAIVQRSSYYYNIKEELDKYMDEGNAVPNIFEWLATVNPNVDYIIGDGELLYNGRPVSVIIDHDRREEGRLAPTYSNMMHEYRSMIIVENLEEARRILLYSTGQDSTFVSNGAVIFLFTRNDVVQAPYYKRGTRWLTLHGYSRCEEFFSPDYRLSEMPTQTDHRRTLYWNPSLLTDEQGKASVIFYSNSRRNQRLTIDAQGIGVNGRMFDAK